MSYLTSISESVTADIIFFLMTWMSSFKKTSPLGSDFDILTVGFDKDIIRAPTFVTTAFGIVKISPNRLLNRLHKSRVNSTCWVWSSPTGTIVASYSKISQAINTGYANSPKPIASFLRLCDFSLNWVIRDNSPIYKKFCIIAFISAWAETWLCKKICVFLGSRPAAK